MYTLSQLHRYEIHGVDGNVGLVEDVYFDDQDWVVRHLVVDSRHWLHGRRVLIPPPVVRRVDEGQRRLEISLTREQVDHNPAVDTAKPVSRQHHVDLYSYYGCPYDWSGAAVRRDRLAGFVEGDPHLRSARAVSGYHVRAIGGEIGVADDFLIEIPSWSIPYVVTRWGHGHSRRHALVPAACVTGLSWEGRRLDVGLSADALRSAPPYDPLQPVDRAYDARLDDYYGRSRIRGPKQYGAIGQSGGTLSR